MKNFTLVIAFLLMIFQLNAQIEKIAGGSEIDINDAPYIVSLQFNGDKHFCGGVIIDCEWILTAAHCVTFNQNVIDNMVVHAGSTDHTDDEYGQRVGIAEVIQHPDAMNNPINEFDIALIRLKKPLVYSNNIQPIEIATLQNTILADIAPGQNVLIRGWGEIDDSGDPVDLLRGVSIPIISAKTANDLAPNATPVLENFHIALFAENTGAGSGDSGGPAIIEIDGNPILVGIGSRRYPDTGEFPSVYMNVRNFTDFIVDNSSTSECESCADTVLDYQLEDEDGNTKTTFCPIEDVYVDVIKNPIKDEYYMDLWTEDDDGELHWISGLGWVPAYTPDGVNLMDLFVNNPNNPNPVNFQEGINYVLKIAVATPECGWIEVLRKFKFERTLIEPADYIFQDENGNEKTTFCVGEDIWVDGSPTIGENKYDIYAWRLLANDDKVWFGSLGTFYGDMVKVNISNSFGNLGVSKYFSPGTYLLTIAYYNDNECKLRTTVEKKFDVECCEDFLDASFTPVATDLNDNFYSIKATDFRGYENHEIVHEWYLMDAADGNIIASSIGDFTYNQAEYGKNYFLIHKLRTACGEICYVVMMVYEQGGQINGFGGLFDCSVLNLECNATAPTAALNCKNGIVNWNQVVNADGYVLRIYYDQGECCDTPLGQPDEVVNLGYSRNSFYSPELESAKCVTVQIGVRCEGQITWGSPQCKECCNLEGAPTDLEFNCLANLGSFSPVEGVESYVVEIVWNDRTNCFCPPTGKESKETLNLGDINRFPLKLKNRCFSFRVGAKCEGFTVWSDIECVDCFDVMPRQSNPTGEELKNLTIVPNSGSSMVRVQVESTAEVKGDYTILSLNGTLIDRQKGSSLGLDLDISNYASGIYFVVFLSEDGIKSDVKRLIVRR